MWPEGPETRSRRTCSGAGPARPALHGKTRLASRPLPVPRIPTDSPPYAIAPPQDMRGSASPQGEARRACAAKPKPFPSMKPATREPAGRSPAQVRRQARRARRHAAHSRESDAELRVGVGDSVGVVGRDKQPPKASGRVDLTKTSRRHSRFAGAGAGADADADAGAERWRWRWR